MINFRVLFAFSETVHDPITYFLMLVTLKQYNQSIMYGPFLGHRPPERPLYEKWAINHHARPLQVCRWRKSSNFFGFFTVLRVVACTYYSVVVVTK